MHRHPSLSSPAARAAACILAVALATGLAPAVAGSGGPPKKGFGPGIESYPSYDGQDTCSPTAKPGVLAFRKIVLAAYPGTGAGGIERGCDIGGTSEHKEGRAWDWSVNAGIPSQRAAAESLFEWLTATDRFGNEAAMARRVGIMYMIFDRKIWFPGSGWRTYCKQKDFGCHEPGDKKALRHPHTDHVHFSFTWDGAMRRTTYWKKNRSYLSGIAAPQLGPGYWLLARTGGVAAIGSSHLGSKQGSSKPVVGMAATPSGAGYWLVDKLGRVSTYGDARHYGAPAGKSKKIVGIEATPSGKGYWVFAKRGRIFAHGDAAKLGKLESRNVLVGMQTTPTGAGYWLATRDGRVLAFGDAQSMGDLADSGTEIAGIEGSPGGLAYWLFTSGGRVVPFGTAQHLGDLSGSSQTQKIVAMEVTGSGAGYWLVGNKGKVKAFGDAPSLGPARTLGSMHRTSPPAPPAGSPLD